MEKVGRPLSWKQSYHETKKKMCALQVYIAVLLHLLFFETMS